jgi:hypothetical protein
MKSPNIIHHINGNEFDNRKKNLLIVTVTPDEVNNPYK